MRNSSTRRKFTHSLGAVTALGLAGCTGDGGGSDDMTEEESMETDVMEETEAMEETDSMEPGMEPTDPAEAPSAAIDRFSEAAGTLHVRANNEALPGADEPIDFDERFSHQGFGPGGEVIEYYDFDVQSTAPAPIYAFFRENGDPVEDQLNVVGAIPGDESYNDFWQVMKVTVPDEYEANTVTSASALMEADYDIESTSVIKNCPVVPEGSTASKRGGDAPTDPVEGWYDGQVVSYFLFAESSLEASGGDVPTSPIYVTFNKNPGQDGGGPSSGIMTETDSAQNHNVVATLPSSEAYSPLWKVNIYDNADFESVGDLSSAMDAEILVSGAANVNCPVVSIQ